MERVLRRLLVHGLTGVRLVTSDAHKALVEAIGANLPGRVLAALPHHYATNLMSVTAESMWPAVKAMLHSVYDQPDPPAVHAQFDGLLDYVAAKLPEVHEHPTCSPSPPSQGRVDPDLVRRPPLPRTRSPGPLPRQHRSHHRPEIGADDCPRRPPDNPSEGTQRYTATRDLTSTPGRRGAASTRERRQGRRPFARDRQSPWRCSRCRTLSPLLVRVTAVPSTKRAEPLLDRLGDFWCGDKAAIRIISRGMRPWEYAGRYGRAALSGHHGRRPITPGDG
jgi:hypothetical protein